MAAAIGGQAVLEGVMMRGPRNWAVAVRKPDGEIAQVAHTIDPIATAKEKKSAQRPSSAGSSSPSASSAAA